MSLMYNCRDMIDLVSKEFNEKLSIDVKIKMSVHLAMCKDCRIVKDQLNEVEKIIGDYISNKNGDKDISLSDDAREKIENILKN